MLFNSPSFLFLFLPVTLFFFFKLGRISLLWASGGLVAASLFFYACWSPAYLGLLIASILLNYAFGLWIAKAGNSGENSRKKKLLVLSITANLAALIYYKYTHFFLTSLSSAVGAHWSLGEIVLPLGISFFTFTQIAFLVDVYRGETKDYNLLHYTLFVTYFPHLIAGPILHHKEIMPQFAKETTYKFNYGNIAVGLTIFLIGLFKKLILADGVAAYVAIVFDQNNNLTFLQSWLGALAYTLQLYFDFSGYSDMAIGISRLFGVILPVNFHSPYKSSNIIDFWRRWHMTLSRFLRDYLYIPLGGNRHGLLRQYLSIVITMLLGGLWHGAGWTFVVWGGIHGFYLVANRIWRTIRHASPDLSQDKNAWSLLSTLMTFLAVVVAWVFFRAHSLESALFIVKKMFLFSGPEGVLGAAAADGDNYSRYAIRVAGMLLIAWFMPNTQQIMEKFNPALNVPRDKKRFLGGVLEWRPSWVWLLFTAGLAFLCLLRINHISEFLYFQF